MSWLVIQADARRIPLADGSVHCVVTSPPYWGLRDYGVAGQIGLEPTPDDFVRTMVQVFRDVRRVLRHDGTCWMNMGDSYAAHIGQRKTTDQAGSKQSSNVGSIGSPSRHVDYLKPKDLIGIPWRVALALQADGWYLRSDVIWSKPNPMPESVTDRPTKAHEYIFLLAKSERYFYDADAIREPWSDAGLKRQQYGYRHMYGNIIEANQHVEQRRGHDAKTYEAADCEPQKGRNRRTVWEIPTQSYTEAHFATYPEKLVEPCILAGTSEKGCCAKCGAPWERVIERSGQKPGRERNVGGRTDGLTRPAQWKNGQNPTTIKTIGWQPTCTCNAGIVPCVVFDPFNGSGTTGAVARKHGRRYVGLELNREYIGMAVDRISQAERPSTARSQRKVVDAPLFTGTHEGILAEEWR